MRVFRNKNGTTNILFSVDNPTLNRFYSAHYLLPFLLAGLVILHLAALHQYGSTNPIGVSAQADQIPFHPYYTSKDAVGVIALGFFASILVFFYPDLLSHPDNNIPANPYSTPAHIVPEYNNCSLIDVNIIMQNPTPCGKLLITKEITRFSPVKRFLLNGQSAREGLYSKKGNIAHAFHRQQMPSLQRLNVGHPDGFINWLVGFIDGDGCFYFNKSQKGTWVFSLKISQSNYNVKLLAYLKKKLQCGSVKPSGINSSQYSLRNPNLLHFFLLPKLSDNPFLTRKKAWQFFCFKKALEIYIQAQMKVISLPDRDVLLEGIKEQSRSIPSTFHHFNRISSFTNSIEVNLGWLIGFTEAEGSFYLNLKKANSLVHAVSWAQKDEKELLEAIRYKFKMKAKVAQSWKSDFVWYKLVTTSAKTIEKLIPLFEGKMKGMKAVEVRKWARSFRKARGNFKVLSQLQHQLRQAKKHSS